MASPKTVMNTGVLSISAAALSPSVAGRPAPVLRLVRHGSLSAIAAGAPRRDAAAGKGKGARNVRMVRFSADLQRYACGLAVAAQRCAATAASGSSGQ